MAKKRTKFSWVIVSILITVIILSILGHNFKQGWPFKNIREGEEPMGDDASEGDGDSPSPSPTSVSPSVSPSAFLKKKKKKDNDKVRTIAKKLLPQPYAEKNEDDAPAFSLFGVNYGIIFISAFLLYIIVRN